MLAQPILKLAYSNMLPRGSLTPTKLQIANSTKSDLNDACRVFSTLQILQNFLGCDQFLDLEDPYVLQNCDSLDFVEELDYLAAAAGADS